MSLKLIGRSFSLAALAAGSLALPGCGGGGGGGKASAPINPVIDVFGPVGATAERFSRTPAEANSDAGTVPPPKIDPNSNGKNHWFRLVFPFPVARSSILENSPVFVPYDYLNGNITVSDPTGDHVPGLALVNGFDATGKYHGTDDGFPHDIVDGVDKNLGANVFLYVANVDNDLSTRAAFGYTVDPLNPNQRNEVTVSNIDTVRITVNEVNDFAFNAIWTIHIGIAGDTRQPFIVRTSSEVRDPTDPFNADSAAVSSAFVVEFSEPVVPHSVGTSAVYDGSNGNPYDGNMPRAPIAPPLPPCAIVATVTSVVGTLFVPFDCEPLNQNNLATYRLTPLIDLPPKTSIDLVVRAVSNNTSATGAMKSPMDLWGNRFDGQDTDGDQIGDKFDYRHTFTVGPGPGVVNVPVSPEVIYWLPGTGPGLGAVDLNGHGFTTNAPFANFDVRELAGIITMQPFIDASGNIIHGNGLNGFAGIALIGSPGNTGFPYNGYLYPIGTGGYAYGAGTTKDWLGFPSDKGNTGTLVPGINEMSSGLDTLCRNSSGDVILTGSEFGRVGTLEDMAVGDFLDIAYFDGQNQHTNSGLHVTVFNSPRTHTATGRGNTIADPPTPNPPPTRYWAGLPPIEVVFDQAQPTESPLLIEGEEVFTGPKSPWFGYIQLIPNEANPASYDTTYFPHAMLGPSAQSSTATFTYSARQQIGNYLYATDRTAGELQVLNSNTMQLIKSIPLPDPTGVGISPDLKRLYVSNFGDDTVSVISTDPLGATFHQEIARIKVGTGPKAVAVQPDNEDVFCCNYLANTVSIISTVNYTIRKTLDQLISQPYDVELTGRQPLQQTNMYYGYACGIYFGYISNFGGNDVVVYESGPDGPQGIGIDGVLGSLPTTDQTDVLAQPRGLCYSPFANPSGFFAGGVFVAHRDADGFGRVSQVQFTNQAIFGPLPIIAPPGLLTPPGFLQRTFEVTGRWGNTDSNRLIGTQPVDVCLSDLNVFSYHSKPSGSPNLGAFSTPTDPTKSGYINSKNHMRLTPPQQYPAWLPDRIYVAFADSDSIQILDATTAGTSIGTVAGTGTASVKKLISYWRE